MTLLTRRKFLKTTAVAGAAGIGLSAMGRFASRALARPDPVMLKTARIEAKLMDVGQTKDVLTYGEAGMPDHSVPHSQHRSDRRKYGRCLAKLLKTMVIPTGIEPVTYRLGICRSILLSYGTTRPDT